MKPFNILLKAHSSSFKMVQFVFQNNEKWRSYGGLNGHRYSKKQQKSRKLNEPFLGSHTSNESKFSSGYICPLGLPTNRILSKSERVMCETSMN